MRILCAGCVKEGKPARLGEKEPLDDPTETYGLCPDHLQRAQEEIAEYRRFVQWLQKDADP